MVKVTKFYDDGSKWDFEVEQDQADMLKKVDGKRYSFSGYKAEPKKEEIPDLIIEDVKDEEIPDLEDDES